MVTATSPASITTAAGATESVSAEGVVMRGIHRSFGENTVLRDVSLHVRPGEVYALLGENGAGKSTLMRILTGLLPPDSGSIAVDGKSLTDGGRERIAMVHQHFMLVPSMTVAENFLLGRSPGVIGRKRLRRAEAEIAALAEDTGLACDPTARVENLSVGEQQRVEILRALHLGAGYLLLDEPTANLAPAEVHSLLAQVRRLATERGVGIVLITHHLEEVLEAADRVGVLRGGQLVAERPIRGDGAESVTTAELARDMVGREVGLGIRRAATEPAGSRKLELVGVSVPDQLHDVTLRVASGQLVAVAGVEGNGQSALEDVLSGLAPDSTGAVVVAEREIDASSPRAMREAGVGIVPADRYTRGLIKSLGIDTNLAIDSYTDPPLARRWGRLSRAAVRERAERIIAALSVKAQSPRTLAGTLSGGHAQRVVLGRVLDGEPDVLVVAQPTRGLDIGATEFVWDTLVDHRSRGAAILLISSDLDEICSLADRIVVLYRGRIVAEFDEGPFDREALGSAMGGFQEAAA
ncbi:ABC transporter ATP-binding protein [Rhodococcus pyridinivorans]|uniref:ABC transporter ATP-binding protein n=1 Tax=Rhodococcus pyridinivorans TaxID=103816 RepID=UPI0022847788|nr:ABC transporter ATP-binding protein [Rhodococcus pyridinivorans]WAL47728.1 ABC transporter ATP-binding protein [Rhodococcus pyridinivorans]